MGALSVPVQVRYSDLDANGHVNNAVFLTLLEVARMQIVRPRFAGSPRAVVARHEIEYLNPIIWTSDPVVVDVWVSRIGRTSIDVCHRLRSESDQTYAIATSVIVSRNAADERSCDISDDARAALAELAGPPLDYRGGR